MRLPICPSRHIFERDVWYLYAYSGTVVNYAESIDAVGRNLAEVRPTVMTSVPRMFEKIYARIIERGAASRFSQEADIHVVAGGGPSLGRAQESR